MTKLAPKNLVSYRRHYSESSLWKKLGSVACKAGEKVVWLALVLYYELLSDEVGMKEKGIIVGALGYFILPLDLIPDFIPVAGYADDLSALLAAYNAVRSSLTPDVRSKADSKLAEWFGKQSSQRVKDELETGR